MCGKRDQKEWHVLLKLCDGCIEIYCPTLFLCLKISILKV